MVTLQVKLANDSAVGLLMAEKPYPLLLRTRFGIHTFAMRFPIDVIVLNDNKKVVAIKESLQPNRVFFWNPKYYTVVELPSGTVGKNKLKVGQKVRLDVLDV